MLGTTTPIGIGKEWQPPKMWKDLTTEEKV